MRRLRLASDDVVAEVGQCARWVRSLLNDHPSAKIGIIAPQLETYRSLIEQMFTSELEPAALVSGSEMPSLFNLSLGRGLDREGVVHAAMKLLRVAMQVEQDEISWMLGTPYLGQAVAELPRRAQIDRELRRLRRFDWTLPQLLKQLGYICDKSKIRIPQFVKQINHIAVTLRKSSRQLPGYWAEHFTTFLHDLGWPGDRGLSSREYQAVEHFHKVLDHNADIALTVY